MVHEHLEGLCVEAVGVGADLYETPRVTGALFIGLRLLPDRLDEALGSVEGDRRHQGKDVPQDPESQVGR